MTDTTRPRDPKTGRYVADSYRNMPKTAAEWREVYGELAAHRATISDITDALEGTDYDPAHRQQSLPACIRAMALDMSNAALRAKQVVEQAEADRKRLKDEVGMVRRALWEVEDALENTPFDPTDFQGEGKSPGIAGCVSLIVSAWQKQSNDIALLKTGTQSLRVVLVVVVLVLASSLAVNALQFAAAGRAVVGGAK